MARSLVSMLCVNFLFLSLSLFFFSILALYRLTTKFSNTYQITLKINEKRPLKAKNFGIWIRYDSRSGTHNMYKEFRELTRTDAVESLYQDMAARHRARFGSIHVCHSRIPSADYAVKILLTIYLVIYRFSVSSKLRRPIASVVLISSNSLPRTSNSLFLTVLPPYPTRRCSLTLVPRHSHKHRFLSDFLHGIIDGGEIGGDVELHPQCHEALFGRKQKNHTKACLLYPHEWGRDIYTSCYELRARFYVNYLQSYYFLSLFNSTPLHESSDHRPDRGILFGL